MAIARPLRAFLLPSLLAALGLVAGCDKASKMCFEGGDVPMSHQVSACGERCEKNDQEACGRMSKVAAPACFEKGDREVCSWMCNYATTGDKDLFCAHLETLPPP